MIIKALVENTSISNDFKNVHGLSLYIETDQHKILFDLGPNNLFLENAAKMGVNIKEIDTLVISHGHYDHGGALKLFLENNEKAKIYIRENAFDNYYSKLLFFKVYIGLNQALKDNDRFILVKDAYQIDDELLIFSDITKHSYMPSVKNGLYMKSGKKYVADTFEHEQNLLIKENNTYTLFAGCAHNGIYNIMKKAEELTDSSIDTVISGFHLMHLQINNKEHSTYLKELANVLKDKATSYYTCHCTGQQIYDFLHEAMGEQMNYISTGTVLKL